MPLNIPESEFRRKKSKKYTKKLNKKFKLDNKLVTGILSTFGIVAIIVIILLVIYIKNTIQDANIRQMENATIIEVKRGDVVRNVEGRGTIEAINHYDITSLVDGDILEDYFEEGQMVEKGDLLYLISHTELDKNIKIAKNDLAKAQETYRQTQAEMSKLSITSNVSGSITKLHIKEGDVVSEGAEIADVIDFDNMVLTIDFLAEDAQNISVGQSATVQIQGSSKKVHGTVSYKSTGTLLNTHGVPVTSIEIRVQNPGAIKSGDKASALVGEYACNSIGSFNYAQTYTIRSEASGTVKSISKKVGDSVSVGTSVATIYNSALEKQLSDNKSAINDAQFTLDSYNEQLNDYKITAPISGKVVEKRAKAGEKLNTSTVDGSMARIEDLSSLIFYINVDETDIKDVYEGQEVSIVPDAYNAETYSGYVDNISTVGITEDNVTVYPVKIVINLTEDTEVLIPGMNVTATMKIDSREDVLMVPSYAVNRGNMVTILNKDSNKQLTKEIEVEVGLNGGEYIEIISGLKEDDSIVVFGETE